MNSVETHVDRSQNLTIFMVPEAATAADYIKVIEEVYTSDPTSDFLWDFAASSLHLLDNQDFEEIAKTAIKYAHLRTNPRTAIVVHKSMEKAVMKLYSFISQMAGSPITYEIFETRETAMNWFSENSSVA